VVCVVFRGGRTLDGVISGVFSRDGLTKGVMGLVRESKHYGQVRVIILDEKTLPSSSCLDVRLIYEELEVPIIFLHLGDEFDPRFMTIWRDRVVEPYGLTEGTVGRILNLVFDEGVGMLRLAHLIAGNLDLMHNV
jgi:hypothetical protein